MIVKYNLLQVIKYSHRIRDALSFVDEALNLTVCLYYYADILQFHVNEFGRLGVEVGVQVVDVLHVDLLPLLYDILFDQILFPWELGPAHAVFARRLAARRLTARRHIRLRLTEAKEHISNASEESLSTWCRSARSGAARRHVLLFYLLRRAFHLGLLFVVLDLIACFLQLIIGFSLFGLVARFAFFLLACITFGLAISFIIVSFLIIIVISTRCLVCFFVRAFITIADFAYGSSHALHIAVNFHQDVQSLAPRSRFGLAVLAAAGVSVIKWIVLVAHGDLYLLECAKHVVTCQDLFADVVQHCQDQLVEEFPFVCEEKIEECSSNMRLSFWKNHGEDREDKIACVQLRTDLVMLEVLVQVWQVLHYQVPDDISMLK